MMEENDEEYRRNMMMRGWRCMRVLEEHDESVGKRQLRVTGGDGCECRRNMMKSAEKYEMYESVRGMDESVGRSRLRVSEIYDESVRGVR